MKKKFVVMIVGLLPITVLACGPKDTLVFSCTTTKGKAIEVCQTPATVSYAFGKKGQKPEMALSVPSRQLDWTSSSGSGLNYDRLTFHNGKTAYALEIENEFGGNGQEEKPSTTATLNVLSGGKTLATLVCRAQGLHEQLDNLNAKPRPE